MTTSQVRPIGGGSWNSITPSKLAVPKNQTLGTTPTYHFLPSWTFALNHWLNCAGTGQHAALAQKQAKAVGLQIQEV